MFTCDSRQKAIAVSQIGVTSKRARRGRGATATAALYHAYLACWLWRNQIIALTGRVLAFGDRWNGCLDHGSRRRWNLYQRGRQWLVGGGFGRSRRLFFRLQFWTRWASADKFHSRKIIKIGLIQFLLIWTTINRIPNFFVISGSSGGQL